jgi:5-methylthioadenosine/S-adenosylhomocysteine deaminase
MILKNATILTTIRNEEIKYNTDIQILDGKIAKIDKNIVPSKNEEIIDCTKKYITPGFINCHTHIPMSLFKEIVDGYPLQT